jgi:two-component system, OmpR family, sensor kinase
MVRADAPASQRSARPLDGLRQLSDRTSLRTKLITAVLVLVIMALAAISIASAAMLRSYLTTQHDTDITSVIDNFNATDRLPSQVVLGYASTTRSNIVLGLQQPGSQLSWLPNLPLVGNPAALPRLSEHGLWPGQNVGDSSSIFSVTAQSGSNTWRVMGETVTVLQGPGQNSTAVLIVAEDLGNLNALTARLILFDLIVGGAIVVVLAVVAIGVVRANLRPLDDIELTAGQIARGHLNHRIPERDPRTEIGSLGHSLNTMLTQIESAFHAQEESEQAAHDSEERMRRFIADASHELRTPLTTIRGFAEYYRQRGGLRKVQESLSRTDSGDSVPPNGYSSEALDAQGLTPQDLDRIMHRLEAEASRMGLLVEDLLQLARIDQQRPLDLAPVDLLTLAADAVQDARMVAPDRPIDLTVAPGAAFIVDGDEQRLRQVIGNLVNNALTHTPPGTPVRVKIASGTLIPPASGPARGGDRPDGYSHGAENRPARRPVPAVVLDVEDDGAGMTADQARRAFERFYRADQARNRASGGTGLGLAIVAGLVAAHGGTVGVRTAPGEGADFQVRLPLSPDAQVDDQDDLGEPDDEESQANAF